MNFMKGIIAVSWLLSTIGSIVFLVMVNAFGMIGLVPVMNSILLVFFVTGAYLCGHSDGEHDAKNDMKSKIEKEEY